MISKRFRTSSLLILLVSLIFSLKPVLAQESSVVLIPIDSLQYGLRLSPDGHTIAVFELGVIHNDEVDPAFLPIRLYDINSQELLHELNLSTDYTIDASFSADGKVLASAHGDGYIYLWDVASGALNKRLPAYYGISALQFLSDNRTLVALQSTMPSIIALWDTETGHITSLMTQRYASLAQFRAVMKERIAFTLSGLAAAPDGTTVATPTSYDDIWAWDIADGTLRTVVDSEEEKPMFNVRSLQFSSDGKLLAYINTRVGEIHVLDAKTGQELHLLSAPEVTTLAIAPNSESVAWTDKTTLHIVNLNAQDSPQEIALNLPEGTRIIGFAPILRFADNGQKIVLGGLANLDGQNSIAIITP